MAVRKGKYMVIFDEDDEQAKDVPYDMVWEVSLKASMMYAV